MEDVGIGSRDDTAYRSDDVTECSGDGKDLRLTVCLVTTTIVALIVISLISVARCKTYEWAEQHARPRDAEAGGRVTKACLASSRALSTLWMKNLSLSTSRTARSTGDMTSEANTFSGQSIVMSAAVFHGWCKESSQEKFNYASSSLRYLSPVRVVPCHERCCRLCSLSSVCFSMLRQKQAR